MPHVTSPRRPSETRSGLLVVDLQPRLLAAIPRGDDVVARTRALLRGAEALRVPFAATVQYPRGLGPLESSLETWLPQAEEKMAFTAAACRGSLDAWIDQGRGQVVVAGIETHVCVEQTVLDLVAEGVQVFVAADAVAARHGEDHERALDSMRAAGATVTGTESILFAWCRTADRPEFKTISGIIKGLTTPENG